MICIHCGGRIEADDLRASEDSVLAALVSRPFVATASRSWRRTASVARSSTASGAAARSRPTARRRATMRRSGRPIRMPACSSANAANAPTSADVASPVGRCSPARAESSPLRSGGRSGGTPHRCGLLGFANVRRQRLPLERPEAQLRCIHLDERLEDEPAAQQQENCRGDLDHQHGSLSSRVQPKRNYGQARSGVSPNFRLFTS
jgi:hypothetical protein